MEVKMSNIDFPKGFPDDLKKVIENWKKAPLFSLSKSVKVGPSMVSDDGYMIAFSICYQSNLDSNKLEPKTLISTEFFTTRLNTLKGAAKDGDKIALIDVLKEFDKEIMEKHMEITDEFAELGNDYYLKEKERELIPVESNEKQQHNNEVNDE